MVKSGLEHLVDEGTIQLDKLSIAPLNGREIKNALRLGMAMAMEEKVHCHNKFCWKRSTW